jgi:hypothetical protein
MSVAFSKEFLVPLLLLVDKTGQARNCCECLEASHARRRSTAQTHACTCAGEVPVYQYPVLSARTQRLLRAITIAPAAEFGSPPPSKKTPKTPSLPEGRQSFARISRLSTLHRTRRLHRRCARHHPGYLGLRFFRPAAGVYTLVSGDRNVGGSCLKAHGVACSAANSASATSNLNVNLNFSPQLQPPTPALDRWALSQTDCRQATPSRLLFCVSSALSLS